MQSERLTFKKIKDTDRPLYIQQVKIDNVMRYITGGGLSDAQAEQRFEEALAISAVHPDYGIFTVWLKDPSLNSTVQVSEQKPDIYIGLARLKLDNNGAVEIGYNLLEAFWGQGYGYEIGKTLMAFLETQADKKDIYAIVEPENLGSVRILEKLGLERTDTMADAKAVYYRLPFQ